MAKVVRFRAGKRKAAPIKRDTYLLWQMSHDIDSILVDAIADKNLEPAEVAAIIAHRLGSLISTTENPKVLAEFCIKVLKRMSKSEVDSAS